MNLETINLKYAMLATEIVIMVMAVWTGLSMEDSNDAAPLFITVIANLGIVVLYTLFMVIFNLGL